MRFPFYKQQDFKDCGPSCLLMIARHYGRKLDITKLRESAGITKEGVSLFGITEAAEQAGFRTAAIRITPAELEDMPLPSILHWNQRHFVVLYKIKRDHFFIADPAIGKIRLGKKEFLHNWIAAGEEETEGGTEKVTEGGAEEGIALLVEPTRDFYANTANITQAPEQTSSWRLLKKYLSHYKKRIALLFLFLLIGSIFQFLFPYLTQGIVDRGINKQNLGFIQLILLAQFVLFFAQAFTEFIRARILLYISTHINLSILSDFWKKLMKLPLSFFETKKTGDIIQRINDHRRIETFITGSALQTIFSLFNLLVFSIVLLTYSRNIFLVFLAGSIVYFIWIHIFLKRRRNLDYGRFAASAKVSAATMQFINGMQEIKLNGAERVKRREWQGLQSSLFRFNFKSLSLNQFQQTGAFFINQGKNIIITYLVAVAVMNGTMTLGQMLAIQYIIGQLNSPVEQLIQFTQQAQEARISLERLNEIQQLPDEEPTGMAYTKRLPDDHSISLRRVKFTYPGAGNQPVLKSINLEIPGNKVTAIVGMSGSGKTTLLKLMLKFFEDYSGMIRVGKTDLKNIRPGFWRGICGSVLQDGFIFNDTIAKNIALAEEHPDREKIMQACRVAEIAEFIESLPLGLDTRIGAEGSGISAGQQQRLFIARAVYKDPEFLFFDEATNALDANTEKAILENLQEFFQGRTVVVAAHRLSTVMNADKIVVIENGSIIEEGTHEELSHKSGKYFELVRNQLELGA